MDSDYINQLETKLSQYNASKSELEQELQSPDVTKDHNRYKKVSKDYAELTEKSETVSALLDTGKQLQENENLQSSESDEEMLELARLEREELDSKITSLQKKLEELEEEKDPYDDGDAIIEIRAGAGGDEACLFAQEMFRAYSKFAETKGFGVELASVSYGATGGFKEVIFFVTGDEVYKTLKFESGVHRVQRVPVTESSGRIHTSAVSVVVLPEIPETEVNIDPGDLRIDVYRAGGPGGQSVNTTDSAVRIVHKPTGIIVTCQDEKSQHKNKAKAMKILQAKLFDIAQQESADKVGEIRQQAIKTGDRSAKIRTYNFPQSRVTDHRIKESWHNLTGVMEGAFDDIVEALHAYNREHSKKNAAQ